MKPKTNPAFSLALICNVPLCMRSTMEPIQTVTLSLELGLLRKTKLKSEQYKTLSVFPLKKINNKGLTQQRLRCRNTGRINNHCRKGCFCFFFFFSHCVFSHKNHDVVLIRMVFHCYLCINF